MGALSVSGMAASGMRVMRSVMLASKFFDDVYYNNAYYARVGGISNAEVRPAASFGHVRRAAAMIPFPLTQHSGRYGHGSVGRKGRQRRVIGLSAGGRDSESLHFRWRGIGRGERRREMARFRSIPRALQACVHRVVQRAVALRLWCHFLGRLDLRAS